MTAQLSPETVTIVKATVPALRAHGLAITQTMYEHLFKDEQIRALFNQSHQGATGSQPKALAMAILAYAENIDNLGALGPAVERIAQKHVGLNIQPDHYPFVATALLQAITDVLGEAATEEIVKAWGEAYWFLAEILIGREATIYRELAAAPGGWMGWREFRVEKVEDESAIIRSFYLRPADGGPVLRHRPGQYLTFWLDIPGHPPLKRNYTISCAPNGEYYRISVKREAAPANQPDAAPGVASNWLHNEVIPGTILKVSPPAGDFFLDENSTRPVVLVSGGVGLTPMVSMLETIVAQTPDLPTWFVHGALNKSVHAMGPHVRNLAQQGSGVEVAVFYSEANDRQEPASHDQNGVITAEWLSQNTPRDEAVYFLCGPKPFLRDLSAGLIRHGVSGDRIRFEFFGPPDELIAA